MDVGEEYISSKRDALKATHTTQEPLADLTLSSITGGNGNTQPLFMIICRVSAAGTATIISGSIENLPSNPPIALLAWIPANPP